MAYTIAKALTQIITNAEPAAGVDSTSAQIATTDKLAHGAWVTVELGTDAYATAPGGSAGYAPSIVVSLWMRHATGGSNYSDLPVKEEVIDLSDITIADAFRAAVYFDCILPEFFVVNVANRTDTAIATNKLNAYIDYVTEATPA